VDWVKKIHFHQHGWALPKPSVPKYNKKWKKCGSAFSVQLEHPSLALGYLSLLALGFYQRLNYLPHPLPQSEAYGLSCLLILQIAGHGTFSIFTVMWLLGPAMSSWGLCGRLDGCVTTRESPLSALDPGRPGC
jgi:hypothetical protein